jgi:nitroreductase
LETLDAIYHRRSIRRYTGKPISDEDLEIILEAGLMAPSGLNLQPWYFVAVQSEENKQ